MAKGSVENVITVLEAMGFVRIDYDLHINFPGGTPIDGPSAGIAMATAIASAIQRHPVDHKTAMTGEISIHGRVKPVGGVLAKVEAAFQAGAKTVIIPKENWQSIFENLDGLRVIPVDTVEEVFRQVFAWVTRITTDGTNDACRGDSCTCTGDFSTGIRFLFACGRDLVQDRYTDSEAAKRFPSLVFLCEHLIQ